MMGKYSSGVAALKFGLVARYHAINRICVFIFVSFKFFDDFLLAPLCYYTITLLSCSFCFRLA